MRESPEAPPLPDELPIEYQPLARLYLAHTKLSTLRRSFCEEFSADPDLTRSALRFFDSLYSDILYDLNTQGNLMRIRKPIPLQPAAAGFIAAHFKAGEGEMVAIPDDARGPEWASVTYTPTPIEGLMIEEKTPRDRSQPSEYAIVGRGFLMGFEEQFGRA